MKDNNNLPQIYKQNFPSKIKKKIPRIKELSKKIVKCTGWGVVTLVGLGTLSVGGPIGTTVGLSTLLVGAYNEANNLPFRKRPDLMFCTQKDFKHNTTSIGQDITRRDLIKKIKDFNPIEKAEFMTLQTMVLLQRYKKELEGTKKELSTRIDGAYVYPKKFSTVTHGINIKNMLQLEKLGYIEIQNDLNEIQYKRNIFGKESEYKSTLFWPRLGFGETEKVKKIVKAFIKGDREELDANKVVMKRVEFKLTDKPLDFVELYKMCNSTKKEERRQVGRFRKIFDREDGILKKRDIDICEDKYGMAEIRYTTQKSFLNKMKSWDEQNEFEKSIEYSELTNEKIEEISRESNLKKKSLDEKGLEK